MKHTRSSRARTSTFWRPMALEVIDRMVLLQRQKELQGLEGVYTAHC
jgi:hypothetical protein